MPFQKGNKLSRGGKIGNKGGRPSRETKRNLQTAAEIARAYIEKHVQPVLDNYLKLARGWEEARFSNSGDAYTAFCYDGATTRHFIDKLLPELKYEPAGATNITFVQFKVDNDSPQLSAAGLPSAVLVGDGRGEETGRDDMAQTKRQGQNGVEFRSFAHVPRERR